MPAASFLPSRLVEQALQRAERLQPHLNFLVLLDREGALAAARASEARWRRREPLSPLDGVPTSIKDTTPVKGWPTRYGSHATDDTPAAEDAAIAGRIRAAGMAIIGKSTTPEFGWKALTDSPLAGHHAQPVEPRPLARRLVGRRLVDDRVGRLPVQPRQ